MHPTKTLASGVAVMAMIGLTATPATANDDTRRITGSCSGKSAYTLKLSDSGTQLRDQRLTLFVNSSRGDGRTWTVTGFKDGERIFRTTRETNDNGNFTVSRVFAADDDADIKIRAKAGYGEHCTDTASLNGSRTTERVTGSCSDSSDYRLSLADKGAELRQQDLELFVNGDRGEGRSWTVTVFEDGVRLFRATRETNNNGNISVNRAFSADDDADIKVRAEAGYGEHCTRTTSLD